MRNIYLTRTILFVAGIAFFSTQTARAQQHKIDVQKSTLTVHVFKTGLFSAFAHNHNIVAPIIRGAAETSGQESVELEVDARALRVMDSDVSEKDRGEIQRTMLGPEVLDSEHFPMIVFRSTGVESGGAGRWILRGNLTLHGQTRPVTVDVTREEGRYTGHAAIKQVDFGIKPVRVAGGTVKVKDEVRIDFNVQLTP